MRISVSVLYAYHRPSRCALRPYLQARDEPGAEPGAYEQILVRLGQRHEQDHLASLGPYVDLRAGSLVSRAEQTLRQIALGERVLYQPVFMQQITLGGRQVELVGVPDFLIRQGRGYLIRDTKLSRHADEDSHPEILRQLEAYGWLYQRSVGAPPAGVQVVLGDTSVVDLAYEDPPPALGVLGEIVQVITSDSEPYSPVGWSKCLGCAYRERCWGRAKDARDVATVYRVDQGLATTLRDQGIRTIDDLAASFTAETLSQLLRPWGRRMQRVGKTAPRILLQAQAMQEERELHIQPLALPAGENLVMFDLEGLPPHLDEADKVYLWGTQVFGTRPGDYQAAVAGFGAEGDRQGWHDFLAQAEATFQAYGDVPFIHWHHYETTKLKMYMSRYGDLNGVAQRVLQNCVDLLPITRDAIALPEPSYSLKVVERRAGYVRKLEEYGGDWSIAHYIEAVETHDQERRQQLIQDILDYNREDLEATWAVFQWLAGHSDKQDRQARQACQFCRTGDKPWLTNTPAR